VHTYGPTDEMCRALAVQDCSYIRCSWKTKRKRLGSYLRIPTVWSLAQTCKARVEAAALMQAVGANDWTNCTVFEPFRSHQFLQATCRPWSLIRLKYPAIRGKLLLENVEASLTEQQYVCILLKIERSKSALTGTHNAPQSGPSTTRPPA
jgi:hypothetical protein